MPRLPIVAGALGSPRAARQCASQSARSPVPESRRTLFSPGEVKSIGDEYVPWASVSTSNTYVRSHHAEAELRLLRLLERQKELGAHRPHNDVLRRMLRLLNTVATRIGPFQNIVECIATHLQRGIFNEEASYYDLWQANDAEQREKQKEMEALAQQISMHKAHEEVKNCTIERLQDMVTTKVVEAKLAALEARNKSKQVERLTATLGKTRWSLAEVQNQIDLSATSNTENRSLLERIRRLEVQATRTQNEKEELKEMFERERDEACLLREKIAKLELDNKLLSDRKREMRRAGAPKKEIGDLSEKFEQKIESLAGKLELHKQQRALLTPRPDWASVCALCPGVSLMGKSSVDAVDTLASELQYRNDRIRRLELEDVLDEEQTAAEKKAREEYSESRLESYEGLGTGPDIPKYLSFSGTIRRRLFSKRQLEIMVNEIWEHKKVYDRNRDVRSTLADFFYVYLTQKYGMGTSLPENSYSFVEALKGFAYDADIQLFYLVLNGELSEDVHDHQMRSMNRLIEACREVDSTKDKTTETGKSGFIDKKVFVQLLRKLCKSKTNSDIRMLVKMLGKDVEGSTLCYETLFEANKDGDQGMFAEKFRDQHAQEILEHMEDMENELRRLDKDATGMISAKLFRTALNNVDSKLPKKVVNRRLEIGFSKDIKNIRSTDMVKIEHVMKMLRHEGAHFRYSPKHEIFELPDTTDTAADSAEVVEDAAADPVETDGMATDPS